MCPSLLFAGFQRSYDRNKYLGGLED